MDGWLEFVNKEYIATIIAKGNKLKLKRHTVYENMSLTLRPRITHMVWTSTF